MPRQKLKNGTQLNIVFEGADAHPGWANMPAAVTHFKGNIKREYARLADVSGYSEARLTANVQDEGVSGSYLEVRYSLALNTAAASALPLAITSSEGRCSLATVSTSAPATTGWFSIIPLRDVGSLYYLHLVGAGGNGSRDPDITNVVLELR